MMFGEAWGFASLMFLSVAGRVMLIYYARIQDYLLEVKFTDVDYRVYTDAARYVSKGETPYLRATYRYTPALAWLLQPNVLFPDFGKFVFLFADIVVGWLIHSLVRHRLSCSPALTDVVNVEQLALRAMCLWLFNPLTAIISTRGNADVLVCAAVLAVLWLLLERNHWLLASVIHGVLAIHLKLYPVIYLPSVFLMFVNCPDLLRQLAIFTAAMSFYLCYFLYGTDFITESLLYHVRRSDVRHNFSPYFYPLYLAAENDRLTALISSLAFLPQAVLIIGFAIRYAQQNLPLCWFLSTFAFVSFNKVCTSQYFVWYLCLVPIVLADLSLYDGAFNELQPCRLLILWFLGQAIWLAPAYALEFHGLNTFELVWIASIVFLLINVYIMYRFIRTQHLADGKIKTE